MPRRRTWEGSISGTVVDLFAGCGGMALGLESAGFEPVFVSELHPDAMRSYLANRSHGHVRRAENRVADITSITRDPDILRRLGSRLRSEHGGELDLVVGGPPCQGYSGIGHRRTFTVSKEEIPSNHLYRDMAAVIQATAPRAFVFENVRGLLTGKWTADGRGGEIWEDVLTTLEGIETKVGRRTVKYRVGYKLVRSSDYGVPQNRPRVIAVGLRRDLDVELDKGLPGEGLLPAPTLAPPDLIDALGDLDYEHWSVGGTVDAYPHAAKNGFQREMRRDPNSGSIRPKGSPVTEHQFSKHHPDIVRKFQYMLDHGGEIPPEMKTKKFAQRVLPARWGPTGPQITVASLPDDYVHYRRPRVLSVREWARLQTFPDWYEFKGRRTTGGRRRAGDPSVGDWSRDVPKYTQIGNAVPVALAQAVGRHIAALLEIG